MPPAIEMPRTEDRSVAREQIVHARYDDIISRIGAEPIWFDENAVPRYCEFEPTASASIYASEVALAEITCQNCGRMFRVAFSCVNVQPETVADAIRAKTLHFGDPPNVGCCGAGPTMNSEPHRVIEYWHRHHKEYIQGNSIADADAYMKWVRDPSLEIDVEPDWVRL